jgi:hypothetical protein
MRAGGKFELAIIEEPWGILLVSFQISRHPLAGSSFRGHFVDA